RSGHNNHVPPFRLASRWGKPTSHPYEQNFLSRGAQEQSRTEAIAVQQSKIQAWTRKRKPCAIQTRRRNAEHIDRRVSRAAMLLVVRLRPCPPRRSWPAQRFGLMTATAYLACTVIGYAWKYQCEAPLFLPLS